MKIVIFTCLAVLLYALQNVLLEQKLAKYTTPAILVYLYLAALPLALIGIGYLKTTRQQVTTPTGSAILLVLAGGVMLFFADMFYVGAYTSGGSLITVTTLVMLFPAFASVIKYIWVGGLPNRYQVAGYVLAAFAILLVAKGNTIQAR